MAEFVYLSLGSNLGDRSANLRAAIERLGEAGVVRAVSGFYETEPVELRDQPWFLNCVVALETSDSPEALLQRALAIEQEMGRLRWERGRVRLNLRHPAVWRSRGRRRGLKIPHPAMQHRRFVLEPLAGAPKPSSAIAEDCARTARRFAAGQVVRLLSRKPDQGTMIRLPSSSGQRWPTVFGKFATKINERPRLDLPDVRPGPQRNRNTSAFRPRSPATA
jgi:2-amino-4-hydroxy-6-hydroxymethyldihydropteridine diphosphokinase